MKFGEYGIAAASALVLGVGIAAQAAESALSEYERRSATTQIAEQHKVAMGRCATLRDNARNVCQAEADGRREVALAHLQLRRDSSGESLRSLARVQASAQYRVEAARCNDRYDEARSACQRLAQMNLARAMAVIRTDQEMERSSAVGAGRR
jgi:hypothetical protein